MEHKRHLKIKLTGIFLLSLFTLSAFAQYTPVNTEGKLFFGASIGLNKIEPGSETEPYLFFQGGLLAEYYVIRQLSMEAQVKYYKIGLRFTKNDQDGKFDGEVLSIPLNLKYEFSLYRNLKANLKMGMAYNIETKSKYDYPEYYDTNYSTNYLNLMMGAGFNYFVSEKLGVFANAETIIGGTKGYDDAFFFYFPEYINNTLYSVGVKYSFHK
jgi:Outer membrane protein beta-barrel domain